MSQLVRALVGALAIGVLGVLVTPRATVADWIWCYDDPTLTVNGRVVHLNLGVPQEQRALVTGATLTVTVPVGVTANLSGVTAAQGTGSLSTVTQLMYDGTYAGTGPIPVSVTAVVNGPSGIPTQLSAWQVSVGDRGLTAATTGAAMSLAFTLP